MGGKITLSELSRLLAAYTGFAARDTESFLKELFFEISSSLEKDDTVKLKGIGSFKTNRSVARKSVDVSTGEEIEIPSHIRVVYSPDKELAAAINAPFSMFESVEISEGVTDEMLFAEDEAVEEEISEPESAPDSEQEAEMKIKTEAEPEGDLQTDESGETENIEEAKEVTATVDVNSMVEPDEAKEIQQSDYVPVPDTEEEKSLPEEGKTVRRGLPSWVWFLFGFGAACVLFVCFVIAYRFVEYNQVENNEPEAEVTEIISEADLEDETVAEDSTRGETEEFAEILPDTQPSDKKMYDTVTKTRYLTTMSREYYGSYHFWPYIYEENEKILGHPDRIRPGTRVVIPSLEKYGVDPKNPADVTAAKKKGAAIYARYK